MSSKVTEISDAELPSTERTLYRMNGTLLNLFKQLERLNDKLDNAEFEKWNWNFGTIAKAVKKD